MNPSTTTTAASSSTRPAGPPAAHGTDPQTSPAPDDVLRQAFESLLEEAEEETSGEEPVSPPVPQPLWPLARVDEEQDAGDAGVQGGPEATSRDGSALGATPLPAPTPDAAIRQGTPEPTTHSPLFAHLSMPHAASGGSASHFEVLGGSLVSGVSVDPSLPGGALSVTVTASAQHAALLDRSLPALQRRLQDRTGTHVRVEARHAGPER